MPAVRKLKIENGDFEDSGKNILHMGVHNVQNEGQKRT